MKLKRKTFLSLCFLLLFAFTFSQTTTNIWSEKSSVPNGYELFERTSIPNNYLLYEINIDELRSLLVNVPNRNNSENLAGNKIGFPNSEGEIEIYEVYEAPVLQNELQQSVSHKSYVGKSIRNQNKLIRFSISLRGFNALVLNGENGSYYIDSYSKDGKYCMSYLKSDIPESEEGIVCRTTDNFLNDFNISTNTNETASRNADDSTLREFELALGCTQEFSNYWVNQLGLSTASDNQKKDGILGVMNDIMTRINAVYENELSITMTIVSNNKNIIFLSDTFLDNNNLSQLINDSQTWIDNLLFQSYDIGHMLCTASGGLAQLFSPCSSNNARAASGTFSGIPSGFSFESIIMHEMGHQYGAFHTYNSNQCAGPSTPSSAYEPGGGTTIMSYAGICASSSNIQSNADLYFHQNSLLQMWSFITNNVVNCDTETVIPNSPPTADAGGNFTIPAATPYKLVGSGSDPDGLESLTYCWEQFDLGPTGLPNNATAEGPVLRSFPPSTSNVRYIPRLQDYVNNVNNSTAWEKLVLVNRDINFRLTVRDNDLIGGQTAADSKTVTIDNSSGPFRVTSQNTSGIIYNGGSSQTVTWNVANTNSGTINETNVNILLSQDGGLTYSPLLNNVVNNGTATVVLPNIEAENCRFMVEAANNIFYNINTRNFAIEQNLSIEENSLESNISIYPNPASETLFINPNNLNITGDASLEFRSVDGRLIIKKIYSSSEFNRENSIDIKNLSSGIYLLKIFIGKSSLTKKIIKK